MPKTATKTAPSMRFNLYFVNEKSHKRSTESNKKTKSSEVIPDIFMGEIMPVTPKIAKMLNTLEPKTFPIAIPLLPLRAATMLVASSGKEVPPATIVSPITASLTPRYCATAVA